MQIFVKEFEFVAYHGVTDAERAIGHRYCVSVSLEVPDNIGRNDQISKTADYGTIADVVLDVCLRKQYRLLEALGHELIQVLFERFPMAETVSLELAKKNPPGPHVIEKSGIHLTLDRASASVIAHSKDNVS